MIAESGDAGGHGTEEGEAEKGLQAPGCGFAEDDPGKEKPCDPVERATKGPPRGGGVIEEDFGGEDNGTVAERAAALGRAEVQLETGDEGGKDTECDQPSEVGPVGASDLSEIDTGLSFFWGCKVREEGMAQEMAEEGAQDEQVGLNEAVGAAGCEKGKGSEERNGNNSPPGAHGGEQKRQDEERAHGGDVFETNEDGGESEETDGRDDTQCRIKCAGNSVSGTGHSE